MSRRERTESNLENFWRLLKIDVKKRTQHLRRRDRVVCTFFLSSSLISVPFSASQRTGCPKVPSRDFFASCFY